MNFGTNFCTQNEDPGILVYAFDYIYIYITYSDASFHGSFYTGGSLGTVGPSLNSSAFSEEGLNGIPGDLYGI